jgi:hypothetical protein
MRVLFADTGYWVALLNPHDDLHLPAPKYYRHSTDDYPISGGFDTL